MSVAGGILTRVTGKESSEPQIRVVTAAQLRAQGRSPAQIRALVRRGVLSAIGHGIYVPGAVASQFARMDHGEYWLRAAAALVSTGKGAALSHVTAALAHNIDLVGQVTEVCVTTGRLSRRGVRHGVRRYQAELPAWQISWKFGLPVTTPIRTVIDLARSLTVAEGVVAADSALRQGAIIPLDIRQAAADCSRRPGSAKLARVADLASGQAESPLESLARVVFDDGGLPPPVMQMPIHGVHGFIGRVDFYWKQYRTIAEVDGAAKYADPDRARKELWRDKALRKAGYEVVHFNWKEIMTEPDQVVASIRAAFARAARNPAA